MANAITLIKKYLSSLIGQVYMTDSKTAILEAPNALVQETPSAGTYMIPKLTLQGLTNYGRSAGFDAGDVTLAWQAMTLANDRGRKFEVDRMDDEESAGIVLANLAGEFMRTQVIPEVDAIRFATIAGTAGVSGATQDIVTKEQALKAFKDAEASLVNAQVDTANTVAFVSAEFYALLEDAVGANRIVTTQVADFQVATYNGIPLIKIPASRFYSKVALRTSGAGGYESDGVALNFIMMDKGAVVQLTKHANGRLFSPDANQAKDAWQYDFRIYHDIFVLDNKKVGIYVSKSGVTEALGDLGATIAKGTATGATKATKTVTGTLGIVVDDEPTVVSKGTHTSRIDGLVHPYTSGADIKDVEAGDWLTVLEFDADGKAKNVTYKLLTAGEIA